MIRLAIAITIFSVLLCTNKAHATQVTFDWALIENPGNTADDTGYGSVGISYQISKHEVTNAQYTEFLNAVAASDPYELYNPSMGSSTRGGIVQSGLSGSFTYSVKADAIGAGPGGSNYTYADKPVAWVSWYDAIRFANWLHNGQGNGGTETGAYTLDGGTPEPSNGLSITRNSGAFWFLPTEDEWYKAAYYNGNDSIYYNYPTASDTAPDNNLPSLDTGNSANYANPGYTTGDLDYPLTNVGSYTLSASPYGTFDQAGNVWEWTETKSLSSQRRVRGGSYINGSDNQKASNALNVTPTGAGASFGFRVASVIPEPTTLTLAALGLCLFTTRRHRKMKTIL